MVFTVKGASLCESTSSEPFCVKMVGGGGGLASLGLGQKKPESHRLPYRNEASPLWLELPFDLWYSNVLCFKLIQHSTQSTLGEVRGAKTPWGVRRQSLIQSLCYVCEACYWVQLPDMVSNLISWRKLNTFRKNSYVWSEITLQLSSCHTNIKSERADS